MQTVKTLANNCGMTIEEVTAILTDAGIAVTGPDQTVDVTMEKKLSNCVASLAMQNAKRVVSDKNIESAAKRLWEQNSNLRAEFNGDFLSYLAYEQACARGLVRVIGG